MVVSLVGRDSDVVTPEFSHLCVFVAQILSVMVSEVQYFLAMHFYNFITNAEYLTSGYFGMLLTGCNRQSKV